MAMFSEPELAVLRRAYARQIAAAAGTADPRLIAALATERREDFVPPGPWPLYASSMRIGATPDGDPMYLYQDIAVPILPEKGLNNGQPSFVTRLIAAADIHEGDRVVHVGAGTGYYTALMARLVGTRGAVLGIEFEPELARRASALLASRGTIQIFEGDGRLHPESTADVVLVNAGTSRLSERWLDALPIGGRLIVPLAVREEIGGRTMTRGLVLRLRRDDAGYEASFVSGVAIYPCSGADDRDADASLRAAIATGGARDVTRLVRGGVPLGVTCWLKGEDWYLA